MEERQWQVFRKLVVHDDLWFCGDWGRLCKKKQIKGNGRQWQQKQAFLIVVNSENQ